MNGAKVESSAADGSMRIIVSGEIDLANAAAVEDEIRDAVSGPPAAVSVDLTAVTYLDSAGVRILFALASRLQALRVMLELVVPLDSPTRRLIELSGFESLVALRPASH
ncbi:MAG: STAS domain-containing protein [Pseudonocardiaceae bacterium]